MTRRRISGADNQQGRTSWTGRTKLIYPGLGRILRDYGADRRALLVRIVVGIMFLMHVSGKFKAGAAAVAANIMAKNGLEPAIAVCLCRHVL